MRLKIERAKKHINDLNIRIRDFAESQPYTIGTRTHPVKEIEHTVLYVASVKPIPNDVGLLIGDAVHNLRSSLDYLVWQLVECAGGTPNRDTYFPICQSPQQYASAIGKGEIQKIGMDAEKLLSAAQPYASGDDTLQHIHDIDIWDKHRLLVVVAFGYEGWRVGNHHFGSSEVIPLEVNQEIVNLPTSTYKRRSPDDFQLSLEIAFAEPQIVKGERVLGTLEHMAEFVDGFISNFEAFLP